MLLFDLSAPLRLRVRGLFYLPLIKTPPQSSRKDAEEPKMKNQEFRHCDLCSFATLA